MVIEPFLIYNFIAKILIRIDSKWSDIDPFNKIFITITNTTIKSIYIKYDLNDFKLTKHNSNEFNNIINKSGNKFNSSGININLLIISSLIYDQPLNTTYA